MHQHVHVPAGGQHVIQAAVADVVSPAVAAEDPDALLHQLIGQRHQQLGLAENPASAASASAPPRARAGRKCRLRPPGLALRMPSTRSWPTVGASFCSSSRGELLLLVDRDPEAQAELRVVLEQRVAPGRPAAVVVHRVRRGRQVAAVDRGATGGVGDDRAVAEQLRQHLDVRRLAAAGAGAARTRTAAA